MKKLKQWWQDRGHELWTDFVFILRHEPRLFLAIIAKNIPLMLASIALSVLQVIAILGFVHAFIFFTHIWQRDVVIVVTVLLLVGLPSIWKNPRCLGVEARAYLLKCLAGQDTLIANGAFGYYNSQIYVGPDQAFIIRDTTMISDQEYAVLALTPLPCGIFDVQIDRGKAPPHSYAIRIGG